MTSWDRALGQGTGGQTWSVILSLCCELGHARILVPEIVFCFVFVPLRLNVEVNRCL